MQMIIQFILGNLNIWTPIVAIILGLMSAGDQTTGKRHDCANILRWFCLLTIGLMGIEGFIMHAFFGEYTAKLIGWADSPFQYEVAVANLSFGVLGVMAFWKKEFGFYLATGIGFAIWFFGDGIGHIYQLYTQHNLAAYNSGSTLYTDLLLPLMVIGLLICSRCRK